MAVHAAASAMMFLAYAVEMCHGIDWAFELGFTITLLKTSVCTTLANSILCLPACFSINKPIAY
jgi:hypothetical protein